MKLEVYEVKVLAKNSTALRELADHHDVIETEADAQGYNSQAEHHKARAHELRQEADRIDRANYVEYHKCTDGPYCAHGLTHAEALEKGVSTGCPDAMGWEQP